MQNIDPRHVGVLLSGGMDTSTASALVSSELGIIPTAFTACFSERLYDETEDATLVTHHFRFNHVLVPITSHLLEELPKIVGLYDHPLGDQSVFAEYFICKEAQARGITTLIIGEGGDEVLGYPRARDGDADYSNLPANNADLSKYYLDITSVAQCEIRHQLLNHLGFSKDLGEKYLEHLYDKYSSFSPFERLYFGQWNTWLIDDVDMKDSQLAKGFVNAMMMEVSLTFGIAELMGPTGSFFHAQTHISFHIIEELSPKVRMIRFSREPMRARIIDR